MNEMKAKHSKIFIFKVPAFYEYICYVYNKSLFCMAQIVLDCRFLSPKENIYLQPNIQFSRALYCAISNNNVTHLFPSAHLVAIVM